MLPRPLPSGTTASPTAPSRAVVTGYEPDLRGQLWGTWPRRAYVLVIGGYAGIVLPLVLWLARTPENLTQAAAISTCFVTLVGGVWQRRRLRALAAHLHVDPTTKVFLLGGLGAAFVETEYEVWQHVFHASGVAASPNLAIDLAVTMPWYLLLSAFLGIALKHVRPTPFQLLLLGGVYEMMSDGLLGSFLGGRLGGVALLLPAIYPLFTLVYAPMVLLPVLACGPDLEARWKAHPPTGPGWWALAPCTAILPYAAGLILLFVVL